jgi:transcriptional regulator with XRE-family HTH domain
MDRRHAKLRSRLGSRLRELRRSQHLSQEQLAARAGLSYKFIGEIERGTGNPTVDTLAVLADALGVDAPYLLGDPPGRQPAGKLVSVSTQDWERLRAASQAIAGVVAGRGGPVISRPRSGSPKI